MKQTTIFISKDVFFWPVVKAAAAEVGCNLLIASKITDPKLETLSAEEVACCLIDLAAVDLADLQGLVDLLRRRFGSLKIIGFASHVHEARLTAAKDAGFDQVLSRGQFSSLLTDHLRQWLAIPQPD